MKIKVIKDAYYISEDLTGIGMVDKATLEASYSHLLVVGDVWELKMIDGYTFFECVEGTWEGELNSGWWNFEECRGYFEVIK
jgi:hypothetical protein